MDTITAIKKALEGVTPDRLRYEAEAMFAAVQGEQYGDTFHAYNWADKPHRVLYDAIGLMRDAACTLESLQLENEELRSALKPYADKYEDITPKPKDIADGWAIHPDDMPDENLALVTIKIGDIRRSRAALSSTGDTHAE